MFCPNVGKSFAEGHKIGLFCGREALSFEKLVTPTKNHLFGFC